MSIVTLRLDNKFVYNTNRTQINIAINIPVTFETSLNLENNTDT